MEYAHKEYYLGALTMSVIACIGSLLSVVNLIPLLITYQLIQKACHRGLPHSSYKILSTIFQTAIMLTLLITVLYLSFQW